MVLPSVASASRSIFHLLLLGILTAFLGGPAAAQTITVTNGATLAVTGGAVWDLHGTTIDLGGTDNASAIDEGEGARFTGGLLTASRTLAAPNARNVAGLGAVLDAPHVLGATTVTRGHAVQTSNGNASIGRYYDITPTTNTGLDATLTLTYHEAELNGVVETALAFFRSTDGGTSWSSRGVDARNASANTATLTGVNRFSRWTLGSGNHPLPVELATFEAEPTDQAVRLRWQTAAETGNARFEVQRATARASAGDAAGDAAGASTRTITWTTVGQRPGAGTTTEAQAYRFTDRDLPYAADSLRYRLRQVDVDGTAHLSDPIVVARGPATTELLGTFPNPARSRATVRYAVEAPTEVDLALYDLLGRRVQTLVRQEQEGRHERRLDTSRLPSGTYFLRLQAGGTTKTQKLTVVR